MFRACTIVTRNELPQARILADSIRRHHAGLQFTALLVDDRDREVELERGPFRVWRLPEIGLDDAEIGRLAGCCEVGEAARALEPLLLARLIDEEGAEVVYLDPDNHVYGPLEEVADLAREHAIVLTPRSTEPSPVDDRHADDRDVLAAGVFDPGFVAVGPPGRSILEWWWQRARRDVLVDPPGTRAGARWLDLAPGLFEPYILRDPGYNVAHWNLHARTLVWTGADYEVDGRPLRVFHFSGFDPHTPYLLTRHQESRPRILLSEHESVARLCREYAGELNRVRADAAPLASTWNVLPGGLRLDDRMRRLYRAALLESESGSGAEPPNPFDRTHPHAFIEWLNEPVAGGLRPRISRYLFSIYRDRSDLQRSFPDLAGRDAARFLDWILREGAAGEQIPVDLVPEARDVLEMGASPPRTAPLPPGLNIVGFFRAESGLGEAGRLVMAAAEAAGIPYATITRGEPSTRQQHTHADRRGEPAFDVNLLCVNADQTPRVAGELGSTFFDGRRTVGLWFWELEFFPESMREAFEVVDEVWAASEHIARGLRPGAPGPVRVFPPPLVPPRYDDTLTRKDFGLPDGFMFLFMFDFNSVFERKNPLAIVDAFTRAFSPTEGPVLVFKSINGHQQLASLERLRQAVSARPDIIVIDAHYPETRKNALLALCDCYVSLHRAEGLGLTMAEAMALGKPVIATAYSGNVDFMDADNSLLVDFGMTTVPAKCHPYPEGAPWAEPDVADASRLMREVCGQPELARRIGEAARSDIRAKHSPEASGRRLREYLDDLRRRPARSAGTSIAAPVWSIGPDGQTSSDLVRSVRGPGPSDLETPPMTNPVETSLQRASDHLAPSRIYVGGGGLRGAMRGWLFRLLKPYWWHERQVDEALVQAIQEVDLARRGDRTSLEAGLASRELVKRTLDEHSAELVAIVREREKALLSHTTALRSEVQRLSSRIDELESGAAAGARRGASMPSLAEAQVAQLGLRLKYQELVRSGVRLPDLPDVEFRCYSQNREDGILLYLFSLVGTTNRRVVEICAGDGVECNAANLIVNHGWHGLLIDGDADEVARGRAFYAHCRNTWMSPPTFVNHWITAENVASIVTGHGVTGSIDLLSLDVDGNDYWIWKALECISPRVVVLEFNAACGPDKSLTISYRPDFRLDFSVRPYRCGASLPAFVKLARSKGYRLVGVESRGFNAFFLRDGVGEELLPERSARECYEHTERLTVWQPSWLDEMLAGEQEWDEV